MKLNRTNFYFLVSIILGLTGFKMIGLLLILLILNKMIIKVVKIPELVFNYFENKIEIDKIKIENNNNNFIKSFISLSFFLILCNTFKFIGIMLIIIYIISIVLTLHWSNYFVLLRKKYEFELPVNAGDLDKLKKICEIKKMSMNINSIADDEFAEKYKKLFK